MRVIRDSLTALVGAGILVVEVLTQPEPRTVIVTLAIAMIGAPSALAGKRQFQEAPHNPPPPEPPKEVTKVGRHAR